MGITLTWQAPLPPNMFLQMRLGRFSTLPLRPPPVWGKRGLPCHPPLGDFLTIKLGEVPRTGGSRMQKCRECVVSHTLLLLCKSMGNTGKRPPSTMAVKSVTFLLLASLALSQALGPAKTCSTGVAEEDPAAVCTCVHTANATLVYNPPCAFVQNSLAAALLNSSSKRINGGPSRR